MAAGPRRLMKKILRSVAIDNQLSLTNFTRRCMIDMGYMSSSDEYLRLAAYGD